ncbi:hypothetical protein GJ496_008498 [Pomphorhynchus laevis]|nr:hypothetical protein GJ496_008498 [Pomphorhynchus laevis]
MSLKRSYSEATDNTGKRTLKKTSSSRCDDTDLININIPKINNRDAPASVSQTNLLVSTRQKGNVLLNYIREVRWQFSDSIIPDFEFSRTNCAIFLSIRYHNLNPEYIHKRISTLRNRYSLRVLLVHADGSSAINHALRELAKMCLFSDLTMIVCSDIQEIALYLEAYKILENKPPDMLMTNATPLLNTYQLTNSISNKNTKLSSKEREAQLQQSRLEWNTNRASEFLTGIRSVNTTDVKVLMKTFGNVRSILCASESDLCVCPGIGPLKTTRICRARLLPFRTNKIIENQSSTDPTAVNVASPAQ